MMIGDSNNVAIELEVLDVVDGWVFGTFVLWISGRVIGNPMDKSVDLKGCVSWLKALVEKPENRFEPGLYELQKEQIFIRLCSSVLAGEGNSFATEKYQDTYSRFHISHIGMSSFDNVIILLVENQQGDARCIWKQGDQEVEEAYLKMNELNEVVASTIAHFEKSKMNIEKL